MNLGAADNTVTATTVAASVAVKRRFIRFLPSFDDGFRVTLVSSIGASA